MKLAYLVQLDLRGHPVKCGSSGNPHTRIQQFRNGTPCDLRLVGCTINGAEREQQMLEATASRRIHGEWRYPTDELVALIREWHDAGEWFVPAPNRLKHVRASGVRERVHAIDPRYSSYAVGPGAVGYAWARAVLRKSLEAGDPTLILDWAGLVPATVEPSLDWPTRLSAAA